MLLALLLAWPEIGFHEGQVTGLPLSIGVTLAMVLKWRVPGAIAAFGTHLIAAPLIGVPTTALMPGALAPIFGAVMMRMVYRRRQLPTNMERWLTLFTCGAVGTAAALGVALFALDPTIDVLIVLRNTESAVLAVMLTMAVVASLRDIHLGPEIWRAGAWIGLVAGCTALALWLAITLLPPPQIAPLYLLMTLPVALWIARQPYSLPGAVVSALGNIAGLTIVVWHLGSVLNPDFARTELYLLFLTIVAQVVHMQELDRLSASDEVALHRQVINDMVNLRLSEHQRAARVKDSDKRALRRARTALSKLQTTGKEKDLRAMDDALHRLAQHARGHRGSSA